ncbi:carotenoid oxygenase [Aspergillus varians]
MPGLEAANTATHFNDWPNDQGFDANREQKSPVELSVTGEIPSYAAGVLYRTGPGRYTVDTENGDTFKISHWFDGFSQTHRFQLIPSENPGPGMRVFYNSRFSTDDLIECARKTGSLGKKITFGGIRHRDPCTAIYQKVQTTYEPREDSAAFSNIGVTLSVNMPGLDNVNVSASTNNQEANAQPSHIKTLHAKTDNSGYKQIHPETLEPLGLADQTILHPDLNGRFSASHARSDPQTGDIYNYNLTFAPTPTYRVFRVSASTGETTILATFPGIPAYIHSFFLTKDYVIICVWNSHLSPAGFAKGSYMAAIKDYDDSLPAKWYVVDRRQDHRGRGLVATYESPAFFCFHTINAWQEENQTDPTQVDIVAECVSLGNTDPLKNLYYEFLLSSSSLPEARPAPETRDNGGKGQSRIARFRLPCVPADSSPPPYNDDAGGKESTSISPTRSVILESTSCAPLAPELPTLNPAYVTLPHRYTYTVIDRGYSTFVDGIMKFDSQTNETLIWSEHAQSPGEAIFVRDPDGEDEDDGVLLTVVLDGRSGRSYLLVLGARDLREVGRASVDGVVAFGFHGCYVSGCSNSKTNGVGAGVDL